MGKAKFRLSIYADRLAKFMRRRLVAANLLALAPEALRKFFLSHRVIFIRLWQIGMISLSLAVAYLVRFDFIFPVTETHRLVLSLGIAICVKLVVFYMVGIEHGWWRFSGLADLVRIFVANVAASTAFTVATALIVGPHFPRSVYMIDFLLCFLLTAGGRFAVRLYHE